MNFGDEETPLEELTFLDQQTTPEVAPPRPTQGQFEADTIERERQAGEVRGSTLQSLDPTEREVAVAKGVANFKRFFPNGTEEDAKTFSAYYGGDYASATGDEDFQVTMARIVSLEKHLPYPLDEWKGKDHLHRVKEQAKAQVEAMLALPVDKIVDPRTKRFREIYEERKASGEEGDVLALRAINQFYREEAEAYPNVLGGSKKKITAGNFEGQLTSVAADSAAMEAREFQQAIAKPESRVKVSTGPDLQIHQGLRFLRKSKMRPFLEYAAKQGYPVDTDDDLKALSKTLFDWMAQYRKDGKIIEGDKPLHPLILGYYNLGDEEEPALTLEQLEQNPAYIELAAKDEEEAMIWKRVVSEYSDAGAQRRQLNSQLYALHHQREAELRNSDQLPRGAYFDSEVRKRALLDPEKGNVAYEQRDTDESREFRRDLRKTEREQRAEHEEESFVDSAKANLIYTFGGELSSDTAFFLDARPPARGADGQLLTDAEKSAWTTASDAAWQKLSAEQKNLWENDPEFRQQKRMEAAQELEVATGLTDQYAHQIFEKIWTPEDYKSTEWLPGNMPNADRMITNLAIARTANELDLLEIDFELRTRGDAILDNTAAAAESGFLLGQPTFENFDVKSRADRNKASEIFNRELRIATEEVKLALSLVSQAGGSWVNTDYYGAEANIIKGNTWEQRLFGKTLGAGLAAILSRPTTVTLRPGVDPIEDPGTDLSVTRRTAAMSEFYAMGAAEWLLDATPTYLLGGALRHVEQSILTMDTPSETEKFYLDFMFGDKDMLMSLTEEQRPAYHAMRVAMLLPFGADGTERLQNLTPEQKAALARINGWDRLRLLGKFTNGFIERVALLAGMERFAPAAIEGVPFLPALTRDYSEYTTSPQAVVDRYRHTQARPLLAGVGFDLGMDFGGAFAMSPTNKKRLAMGMAGLFLLPEFVMVDALTIGAYSLARGIGGAKTAYKTYYNSPKFLRKTADELQEATRLERLALISGTEEDIAVASERVREAAQAATTNISKKNPVLAHLLSVLYSQSTGTTSHYMNNVRAIFNRTRRTAETWRKKARQLGIPEHQINEAILGGSHLNDEVTRAAYVRTIAEELQKTGMTRFDAYEQARKVVKEELATARKAAEEAPAYELYKLDSAKPGVVEYYIKDSDGQFYKWFEQTPDGQYKLVDESSTRVIGGRREIPNSATGKTDPWDVELRGLGEAVAPPLGAVPHRWDVSDLETVRRGFADFFAKQGLATWRKLRKRLDQDGNEFFDVEFEATIRSGVQKRAMAGKDPVAGKYVGAEYNTATKKWEITDDYGNVISVSGPRDSPTDFLTEAESAFQAQLDQAVAAQDWWTALKEPVGPEMLTGQAVEIRRAQLEAQKVLVEALLENAHAEKALIEALLDNWNNNIGPQYQAWKQASEELPKVQKDLDKALAKFDTLTEANAAGPTDGLPQAKEYALNEQKLEKLSTELQDLYEAGSAHSKTQKQIDAIEAAQRKLFDHIADIRAKAQTRGKDISNLLVRISELTQRRDTLNRVLSTAENAAMRRQRLSDADPVITQLLKEAQDIQRAAAKKGVSEANKVKASQQVAEKMAAAQARLHALEGVASKASTVRGSRTIELDSLPLSQTPREAADGTKVMDYNIINAQITGTLDDFGYQVGDAVKLPNGETTQIVSKEWASDFVAGAEDTGLSEVWVLGNGSRVEGILANVTHDNLLQKGMVLSKVLSTGEEVVEAVTQVERIGDESLRVTLRATDGSSRQVAIRLSPDTKVINKDVPLTSIDDLLEGSKIIITTPVERRIAVQQGWLLEGHKGAQIIIERAAKRNARRLATLEKRAQRLTKEADLYGDTYELTAAARAAAARFDLAAQDKRARGVFNTLRKLANDIEAGRGALEGAPVLSDKFIDILKGAVIKEPASAGFLVSLFRKIRRGGVTADGDLTYTVNPAKMREILVEAWGEESVALILEQITTAAGATRGGGAADILARLLGDSLDEAGFAEYDKAREAIWTKIGKTQEKRRKLVEKMEETQDLAERIKLRDEITAIDDLPQPAIPPKRGVRDDVVISLEDFEKLQTIGEQLRKVWKITHAQAGSIAIAETLENAKKAVWTLIGSDRRWHSKVAREVKRLVASFNPLAYELGSLSDDLNDVIKGGINLIDESGSELAALIKVALRSSRVEREQMENAKELIFQWLGAKASVDLDIRAPFIPGIARPGLEKGTWVNTSGEGTLWDDLVTYILGDPRTHSGGVEGARKEWAEYFTDADKLFEDIKANKLVKAELAKRVKQNGLGADMSDALTDLAHQVQAGKLEPKEATKQLRALADERPVTSAGISSNPDTWLLKAEDMNGSNPFEAIFLSPLGHGTGLSVTKGQQAYFRKTIRKMFDDGKVTKTPELFWDAIVSLYRANHESVGYYIATDLPEAMKRVGDLRGFMMFTQAVASGAVRKRVADLLVQTAGARILPSEAAAANKIIGDGMANWDELTDKELAEGIATLSRLGVPIQQAEASVKGARDIERLSMELTMLMRDPQGRGIFTPRALLQRLNKADPHGMIKSTDMVTTQARVGAVANFGSDIAKTWRTSVVTGLFHPRMQYFYNNFYGDISQIHTVLGTRQSIRSNVSFIRGIPTWFKGPNSVRSKMAKALGVDVDSVLPGIRESLHQPDLAAIFKGEKRWIRTESGQLTSSDTLKDAAVRYGVMESYANQDLMKFVTQLSRRDTLWMKGWNSFVGWQNDISDFATYVQQRQRFALFVDLHRQGYTLEAAAKKSLDALYDWKFGLARWEAALMVPIIPFYRFWRLSIAQQMRENLRLMSRPPKEVLDRALKGRTALGRARAQQQALKALPYITDPIAAEDMGEDAGIPDDLTGPARRRAQRKAAADLTEARTNKIGATWMGNARGFTTYRYATKEERRFWWLTRGKEYKYAFKTTGPTTGIEALNLVTSMSQGLSMLGDAFGGEREQPGTARATGLSAAIKDDLLALLWPHQKALLEVRIEGDRARTDYRPHNLEFEFLTALDRSTNGYLDFFTERGNKPGDSQIGWGTMMGLRYVPPVAEVVRFLTTLEKTPELAAMLEKEGIPEVAEALVAAMALGKTTLTGGVYPGSLEVQKERADYELGERLKPLKEDQKYNLKPRTPTVGEKEDEVQDWGQDARDKRDMLELMQRYDAGGDVEYPVHLENWWNDNIGGDLGPDAVAEKLQHWAIVAKSYENK